MHGRQWVSGRQEISVGESEEHMNREQAQVVIEVMLKQGSELNALLVTLQEMGLDADAFACIRKSVGMIMGSILLDIMNPVFEMHPDLKPKELN